MPLFQKNPCAGIFRLPRRHPPSKSILRRSMMSMLATPRKESICITRFRGIMSALAFGSGKLACHGLLSSLLHVMSIFFVFVLFWRVRRSILVTAVSRGNICMIYKRYSRAAPEARSPRRLSETIRFNRDNIHHLSINYTSLPIQAYFIQKNCSYSRVPHKKSPRGTPCIKKKEPSRSRIKKVLN
jgi:hypothetical protein